MRRVLTAIVTIIAVSTTLHAGQTVRIIPAPRQAEVDGMKGATIKRMPEGGEFLLTVNKGQDVSYYRIQWFKDGVELPGETGQDLRYPIASADMNGVYTVKMSNPCATVESSPISVYVERRNFQVNTQVPREEGIAGVNASNVSLFSLSDVAPNPVTDRATLSFTTREEALVTLRVMDMTGAVVATLVNDVLPAGDHTVSMNTKDHNMSSSLYYVVLSAPGFTDTKPLVLAK
jgi:hypothetical protein